MPGSRKCSASCKCGKHQGGGLWNPFKHAKRDFGNVVKVAKKIVAIPGVKQALGSVIRAGITSQAPGASAYAEPVLGQLGLGRKRKAIKGAGRGSVKAGGGSRKRR